MSQIKSNDASKRQSVADISTVTKKTNFRGGETTKIQKFLHKSRLVGFNKTFICCKESLIESPTSFYGCFYLGPFPESFSLTLSHNLRRTLLSEIPGLAITAVEIDGVLHKYSNIPGIKETVLDILSNLQNIVFVKTRLSNSFIAFLQVRGPGIVKASDIKLPAGVALVNPDQHIATLAEDGSLTMKIWIHEGKNAIKQKPQNTEESPVTLGLSDPHNASSVTQSWGESIASLDYSSISDFGSNVEDTNSSNNGQTSLNSNKLYLDSVFMPVTKVNTVVETNFKATDDPAKAGPFVFQTSSLVANLPDNRSFTSETIQTTKDQKTLNPFRAEGQNYFDFMPDDQTDSANTPMHYLVLKPVKPEVTNSDLIAISPEGLETLPSLLGKPNVVSSESPNPILIPPVSYNQPPKQCHIVLEIWTNGSIHPRQALKECLDFLTKTFIGLNNVRILDSIRGPGERKTTKPRVQRKTKI